MTMTNAAPDNIKNVEDARTEFKKMFNANDVEMLDAATFEKAMAGIFNASVRQQSQSLGAHRQSLHSLVNHISRMEGQFAMIGAQVKPVLDIDELSILRGWRW